MAHVRNDMNTIVSLKLKFTSHIDSMDCYDRIRNITQGLGLATPARADVLQLHPNIILIKKMSCLPSIFKRLTKIIENPGPDEKARFVSYGLDSISLVSKELTNPKQTPIPQQIGTPITPPPTRQQVGIPITPPPARQQVGIPILPSRPSTSQVPPKANSNLQDRTTSTPRQTPIPQQTGIPILPSRPSTSQVPPKANSSLPDRTTSAPRQTLVPQQIGIPLPPRPPTSQVPPEANSSLIDRIISTSKRTPIPQQVGVPITPSRPTSQVPANSSPQDRTTSTPRQTPIPQQVGIPITPPRPPTSQVLPKANSSLQTRTTSTSPSVPVKVAQTQPTPPILLGTDMKTHTVVPPSQLSNESETLPSPAPSQRKRVISNDEKNVGPPAKRLRVAEPGEVVESVSPAKYLMVLQKYGGLERECKQLEDTLSELRATLENREQEITSITKSLEAEKFRSKTLVQGWNAKKGEMLDLKATHQKENEKLKQELASERNLRLRAEKIVEDIRQELTYPFIVPSLIDAFILFSQNLNGSVPEDSSSVSPTDTAETI